VKGSERCVAWVSVISKPLDVTIRPNSLVRTIENETECERMTETECESERMLNRSPNEKMPNETPNEKMPSENLLLTENGTPNGSENLLLSERILSENSLLSENGTLILSENESLKAYPIAVFGFYHAQFRFSMVALGRR
jgi:hypothetical protein